MKEQMNYYQIPREEWQGFYTREHMPLKQEELDNIKSLNDRIYARCRRCLYSFMPHDSFIYERI